MSSDEDLVRRALDGDDGAFDQLVIRYRDRLFRFLLMRSATRSAAEDALQETFVNAYRYLASFNPRWRFSTWLYRIGIRSALKQSRFESQSVASVPVEELADLDADPEAKSIVMSDRENLWSVAKSALSADAYTALWLRYAEDMPVKEVAHAMGRGTPWAKVTLMRARRRLQVLVAAQDARGEGEVYG